MLGARFTDDKESRAGRVVVWKVQTLSRRMRRFIVLAHEVISGVVEERKILRTIKE